MYPQAIVSALSHAIALGRQLSKESPMERGRLPGSRSDAHISTAKRQLESARLPWLQPASCTRLVRGQGDQPSSIASCMMVSSGAAFAAPVQ